MGSKNRIFLGYITSLIVHHHRNIFLSKKLYISKRKSIKIKSDHPQQSKYINEHNFQILLDNTIASCNYKENGIINFITNINETYFIFGVSINNHYTELGTIFKPSIRQLVKCKDSIKFFSELAKKEFEKYIS